MLVVEPSDKIEEAELAVLRRCGCPVLLAINKIDTVKKETLLSVIAAYAGVFDFAAVVPISALTGEGVEELYEELASRLEEGPAFFPEDAVTDQTERPACGRIYPGEGAAYAGQGGAARHRRGNRVL